VLFRSDLYLLTIIFLLFSQINAQKLPADYEILIPTFLGNWQRNYYGNEAPDNLKTVWRTYLGKGKTIISKKIGEKEWAGTGWTGQSLLIRENQNLFLILGCYDHNLKKINSNNGQVVWQYKFDDVIKGTGTLWENKKTVNDTDRIVILQGSRRGFEKDLYSKNVPSYRAISYQTGSELWRLNVSHTASYSRDVDGSAVVLNDTAYIGLENGIFTVFSPDHQIARNNSPKIYQELKLYTRQDMIRHGGNLVTESSPAKLNNHLYISSGSGHVFGYNLLTKRIDWDFYIGSDMDGSPVVTSDSCIIVTVEKQYIPGQGGVFKLNPAEKPENAVVWYFPTQDDSLLSWAGGVIGSVGINDMTRDQDDSYLCGFIGIDGYLYVVNHKKIDTGFGQVPGPDSISMYDIPELVYKYKLGPSISTPIFVKDKLVAAGYHGIYLFKYDTKNKFDLLDRKRSSAFESTPIVHNGRLFIGSRDGYLYCLGKTIEIKN